MDFFFPGVKNQAMSHLLNACFAIAATSVYLLQNCRVIYKTTMVYIRTINCNIQGAAQIFPSIHQL